MDDQKPTRNNTNL